MTSLFRGVLVSFVAIAVIGLTPLPGSAVTLNVNSAADPGIGICDATECTLREAILAADATPAVADLIQFDIPGGSNPVVIDIGTAELPAIDSPVTIDGFSDPDSDRVQIHDADTSAGSTADGLTLNGSGVVVVGLVIRNFGNDGVDITDTASGNTVERSYIGTDGTVDQGNGGNGIDLRGAGNLIGGPSAGNVISGNGANGINITGSAAASNQIKGNFIGTDSTGSSALGNSLQGIVVGSTAHDNVIGGTSASERNVVSANGQGTQGDGIRILGGANANTVLGNFIGTNATGTAPLPNLFDGVNIRTAAFANTVGGTAAGAGNVISSNTDDGVQVDSTSTGNAVLGNSISGNGNATAPHNELGIDLQGVNGVDANDAGDADAGGNNLQNFPVLNAASSGATTTTIGGSLNSEASKTYRLEFFSNAACDPSSNGEGEVFVGATNVMTDGAGNASFTVTFSTAVAVGRQIAATATDPGNNTSEFSVCRAVIQGQDPPPPVSPTTPTTSAGPRFQKQRTFTVSWGPSTSPQPGQIRYDVRYREAPYNGGFGGLIGWQAATTATSAALTGTPGTTYCFSARAIDGAGNASPYGPEGCTAVPVDNTSFKHRGRWAKKSGTGYYLNTFSRTRQRGARLTLPAVQAKVLSIIVTKCRGCGTIKVFFKGTLLKKIRLRTKATTRQKLRFVNLTTFASAQTGTVRVTVVSRGKLVIVEGLGVSAV